MTFCSRNNDDNKMLGKNFKIISQHISKWRTIKIFCVKFHKNQWLNKKFSNKKYHGEFNNTSFLSKLVRKQIYD